MKVIFLLILFTTTAYSSDNWYCKEVSSEKGQGWIKTCGIGHGSNETIARKDALKNAYNEFKAICGNSISCRYKDIDITPHRTTCDVSKGVYTCHRLFQFHLINKEDVTESHVGKIRKGMSMKSVIRMFGKPDTISETALWADATYLYYNDREWSDGTAQIEIINGKVNSFNNINPEYDGRLE